MWLNVNQLTEPRRSIRLAALLAFVIFGMGAAHASSPVEGTWATPQGTEVTIAPCATDQGLCGSLSHIVIPDAQTEACTADLVAFQSAMVDFNNADLSLRSRPLLGLEILKLQPGNSPTNFNGNIYNVQDGKNYDGVIDVIGGDTLRLGNGCVFNMCMVTQDWTRVPERVGPPDVQCSGAGAMSPVN